MRALERYLLLQIIDQRWREHLYDMDYLREGIHLRGFAQIEPLVAYKNEALHALPGPDEHHLVGLRAHDLQRRGRGRGRERRRRRARRADGTRPATRRSPTPAARSRTSRAPTAATATASRTSEAPPAVVEQRRVDEHEQLGRNDPCWCGSGKKFKKCHGA